MKSQSKLLTAAIVICSIVTTGVFLAAIYNLVGFAITSVSLEDIEREKLDAVVVLSETYLNPNTKYQSQNIKTDDLDDYKYLYMLNDIAFISYSDKWDEDKLKALSEELLKNKHGEEIEYLAKVKVMAESSSDASGFQETSRESYSIPVSLYNFFPQNTKYKCIKLIYYHFTGC